MGLIRKLARVVIVGRPHGYRARAWHWLRGEAGEELHPSTGAPAAPSLEDVRAPEGFSAVLWSSDLVAGEIAEVIAKGVPLAVCRVGERVYAVSAVCPHAGGPIADGQLAEHTVTCPYHGWSFDIRDGKCFVDDQIALPTFEVVVHDGAVCVRL